MFWILIDCLRRYLPIMYTLVCSYNKGIIKAFSLIKNKEGEESGRLGSVKINPKRNIWACQTAMFRISFSILNKDIVKQGWRSSRGCTGYTCTPSFLGERTNNNPKCFLHLTSMLSCSHSFWHLTSTLLKRDREKLERIWIHITLCHLIFFMVLIKMTFPYL